VLLLFCFSVAPVIAVFGIFFALGVDQIALHSSSAGGGSDEIDMVKKAPDTISANPDERDTDGSCLELVVGSNAAPKPTIEDSSTTGTSSSSSVVDDSEVGVSRHHLHVQHNCEVIGKRVA
jgi:hypothetical protein